MCHSRKINTQISKLHERALRLVYNDKSYSFRELLERDNAVTIHKRNIQVLLTLKDLFISESCIEIKIELNFYFHTSLWCLKRFHEGLRPS